MNAEDLYVINLVDLNKLRDLLRRRDEQTFIAGCALLEHEHKVREVYAKYRTKPRQRNQNLGALDHALREATDECYRKVRASKVDEKMLADEALRRLGIEPDEPGKTYTIDKMNGVVMILENGKWKPLERTHGH